MAKKQNERVSITLNGIGYKDGRIIMIRHANRIERIELDGTQSTVCPHCGTTIHYDRGTDPNLILKIHDTGCPKRLMPTDVSFFN